MLLILVRIIYFTLNSSVTSDIFSKRATYLIDHLTQSHDTDR